SNIAEAVITDVDGNTVTEVQREFIYDADAEVTTTPTGGINTGVRWAVEGASSNKTAISSSGVLHVGGDEQAESLTVVATSTWIDSSDVQAAGQSASSTVTVIGEEVIDWPATETGSGGDGGGSEPATLMSTTSSGGKTGKSGSKSSSK